MKYASDLMARKRAIPLGRLETEGLTRLERAAVLAKRRLLAFRARAYGEPEWCLRMFEKLVRHDARVALCGLMEDAEERRAARRDPPPAGAREAGR